MENSSTNTVKQFNPLDFLKIVFRRKWLIIVPVFIGIIGGIVAGNVLPKVYQSSTLILVEEGKVINPLIQGIAVSTSVSQRLGMLREQILGWDRLMQLIKALNLDKDVRNQLEFEELVKKLRKNIIVNIRGQNLITLSYGGADPVQSQNIVKTITDIFISENVRQQNREAENAIDFINDQVTVYQKKMKETEIATMEDQLKKLMVDSTEKHPMVQELRKKIESARVDLDKGNYNVDSAVLGSQNKSGKEIKEELKKLKDEMAAQTLDATDTGSNRAKVNAPSSDKLYKLLLLDKLDKTETADSGDVTKKLYDDLLARLETAKITQRLEASREGTRYTILDPARVPLKPTKPNKLVVLLLGLMIGAGVGGGLVFMAEMFDNSFLDIEEAREHLKLPVFGAVSKIITQEDVRLQNMRNLKVGVISALAGIVLFVAIVFNFLVGH